MVLLFDCWGFLGFGGFFGEWGEGNYGFGLGFGFFLLVFGLFWYLSGQCQSENSKINCLLS